MKTRIRARFMRVPSPAMAVALLALFVALGGSATAAGILITGRNVKDGSLTGIDIKNNSVRGADIRESSLGRVPAATKAGDADALDTLDSTAFARSEHNHDGRYYTAGSKVADADELDGNDSSAFATRAALQSVRTLRRDGPSAQPGGRNYTLVASHPFSAANAPNVVLAKTVIRTADAVRSDCHLFVFTAQSVVDTSSEEALVEGAEAAASHRLFGIAPDYFSHGSQAGGVSLRCRAEGTWSAHDTEIISIPTVSLIENVLP